MNSDRGSFKKNTSMKAWRIFLFLLVVCAGFFFLVALIGGQPMQWLLNFQGAVDQYVSAYPVASALFFVAVYGLALSCGFPGGALFALFAGFLFGPMEGLLLVFCGLAGSAVLVRVITRKSGLSAEQHTEMKLAKWFANSTKKNPFLFPVLIRMIPVFPFFWLNLIFSLTRQPWPFYLSTALVGALPAVLALVVLGDSMQYWLQGEQLSLSLLVSQPMFIVSWSILAGLAIVGYCWKRFGLQQAE